MEDAWESEVRPVTPSVPPIVALFVTESPVPAPVRDAWPAVMPSVPMSMAPNPDAMEPDARTPVLVMLSCVADGMVDEMEGTPPTDVTRTPLLAVVIEESVSAAVVKRMVFVPPKVVRAVPPRDTARVPVVSESAMPKVEVATRV